MRLIVPHVKPCVTSVVLYTPNNCTLWAASSLAFCIYVIGEARKGSLIEEGLLQEGKGQRATTDVKAYWQSALSVWPGGVV